MKRAVVGLEVEHVERAESRDDLLPGARRGIGGLPLIRQLGTTVTMVSGSVPTMVTAERSMMLRILTGCPAGQPITR